MEKNDDLEYKQVAGLTPSTDVDMLSAVEFSPDDKYLVIGYDDGIIRFGILILTN
ncbi:MAG: hypothetical protein ACLFPS_07395 [Clostridia bacterium]